MTDTTANSTEPKRIFYPGHYYTVTANNTIKCVSTSRDECVDFATDEGDTILVCVKPVHSAPKPKIAEKIIVDFDKLVLTIVDGPVKLSDVTYINGEHNFILDNWERLVKEVNSKAKTVEYVGVPPVAGKDVTNEMSNL